MAVASLNHFLSHCKAKVFMSKPQLYLFFYYLGKKSVLREAKVFHGENL